MPQFWGEEGVADLEMLYFLKITQFFFQTLSLDIYNILNFNRVNYLCIKASGKTFGRIFPSTLTSTEYNLVLSLNQNMAFT